MPIDVSIIPDRGLVVVRYSGHATIDETLEASAAYLAHRNYVAGQKQLVDMTLIESFEKDYVRFMEMQAEKAERLACANVQSLVVYIAPTRASREVARLFLRSWDDVAAVVPMMQPSEAEALTILGQPETSIAELFETFAK